jgi:ubiquinone/menaquinone biosynthesis C-methylase UbiE
MSESIWKAYDEKAETYDTTFGINFFRIYDVITWKYLEPYLPKNRDAVVLDAGGGTGRWSMPMAKTGLNVVLVDVSEGMLNVARRRVKEVGYDDKITVGRGDITKLEYSDETFDLVFCEHVLFLIEEPAKAIKELTRVLKRGCPLIISCPNTFTGILMCLKHDFPKHIDRAMNMMNGTFTFVKDDKWRKLKEIKGQVLTPTEFRRMLEDCGLKVMKIVGKVVTMLGWSERFIQEKTMSPDLLQKLLEIEMRLCEREDVLGVAAHLQAIAYKEKS